MTKKAAILLSQSGENNKKESCPGLSVCRKHWFATGMTSVTKNFLKIMQNAETYSSLSVVQ